MAARDSVEVSGEARLTSVSGRHPLSSARPWNRSSPVNKLSSSRSSAGSCSAHATLSFSSRDPRGDVDRLAKLVDEMDELFLLVIAGEYNTGKSTFINALLGDEVFAMGDLPTTREIAILRYGKSDRRRPSSDHTLLFHYPLDVLRDLEIVDTPGTNSIERMEEEITRGFVPRADLVLFVTSLLQPLTASEMGFLSHIREWGKKVIFVVNGVDRRNSDEQIDRVRDVPRPRDHQRDSAAPRRRCTSSAHYRRCARRLAAPKRSAGRRRTRATSSQLSSAISSRRCASTSACASSCSRHSAYCDTCSIATSRSLETRLEVVHADGSRARRGARTAPELWRRDAHGLRAVPAGGAQRCSPRSSAAVAAGSSAPFASAT